MAFNPIHVIFGLKLRQARLARHLSITELSERSGLSPSYITEIEKGRKYPKAERIMDLARALGYDYDELVSLRLDPPLSFLETPLTSQMLQNFPLELFGVDPSTIVDVLTRSPAEMSALIKALQGIARGYAIRDEHFYLAALRSYQEHHHNYFPELEKASQQYAAEQGWSDASVPRDETMLMRVLSEDFGYEIDEIPVNTYPALAAYRAVMQPCEPGGRWRSSSRSGRKPRLLLNPALMPSQRKFILAREIGYNVLDLEERALANSPDRVESFAQVLNDFKASYFGGALLMPEHRVADDLRDLFSMTTWQPARLQRMLDDYDVTPETLLYRFSELVPRHFDLKVHFLRFNESNGVYRVHKHLNMNELSLPTGFDLREHYCRRWLTVRLLRELSSETAAWPREPSTDPSRSRGLSPTPGGRPESLPPPGGRRESLPPPGGRQVSLPPPGGRRESLPPPGGRWESPPTTGGRSGTSPMTDGHPGTSPITGGPREPSPPTRVPHEPSPMSAGPNVHPLPGIQRSRFLESNKQFLCMGFARADNLPPYSNTSVILGIRIDDDLAREVKFASDPAIPEGLLNETCERCPLSDADCSERAAPPSRWLQEQATREREQALAALLQGGQRPGSATGRGVS